MAMKVLMTLENSYRPDIRVEKEVKTLTESGYEVTLACITRQNEPELEKVNGLTILRKKIPDLTYKTSVGALKFPCYFNFWRFYLSSILKKEQFALIHVHDLPLARVASEISKKYKIPFILDLHENYPFLLQASPHIRTLPGKLLSSHQQWIDYEQEMVRKADALLSVIEEQRDRLINLGADPKKIFLVSNTPVWEDLGLPPKSEKSGKFVFIYAGNFDATRGLEILLEAFEKTVQTEPNILLWLVGDGKNYTKLQKQILSLSGSENIILHGWKPYRELLKLIAQADVALLPHLRNGNSDFGIPNKLFQYMMLGKPVIASDCPPIVRILSESHAGLTYRDRNADQLSEKMLYAIQHPDQMDAFGQNGRKAVQEKYNWKSSAQNLLAAYQSILRDV